MWKKLIALQFSLFAIFVTVDGCWRPITSFLDELGIHVSTDNGVVDVSVGDSHNHDD